MIHNLILSSSINNFILSNTIWIDNYNYIPRSISIYNNKIQLFNELLSENKYKFKLYDEIYDKIEDINIIKSILPYLTIYDYIIIEYIRISEFHYFILRNTNKVIETLKLLLPISINNENYIYFHKLFSSINLYKFKIIKLLLPYLVIENILINYNNGYNALHHLFKFTNLYHLDVIKLLLPYLDKNDLSNSLWIVILNNFNPIYLSEVGNLLIPLLDKKILTIINNYDETIFHIIFKVINSIKNFNIIEIINILLPNINKKILKILDKNNKTCFHLLFENIENDNHINILNLLLPYLDKKTLLIKDNINRSTCWHYIFKNINKCKLEILKILLPYLDRKTLLIKDKLNRTCLHYIFNSKNEYTKQVINLLLPYLNREILLLKDDLKQTCWHYILQNINIKKNDLTILKLLLNNLFNENLLIIDDINDKFRSNTQMKHIKRLLKNGI